MSAHGWCTVAGAIVVTAIMTAALTEPAYAASASYGVTITADDDALARAGLVAALTVELGDDLNVAVVRLGPPRATDAAHLTIVDRDGELVVTAIWPSGRRLTRSAPRPANDADAVEVVRFIVGTMLHEQDDALAPPSPPGRPAPTWDYAVAVGGGVARGGTSTMGGGVTLRVGYRRLAFGLTASLRGDDHSLETSVADDGTIAVEAIDGIDRRLFTGVDLRLLQTDLHGVQVGILAGICRVTEHGMPSLTPADSAAKAHLAPLAGVALGVSQRLVGPLWLGLRGEAWSHRAEAPRLDAYLWLGWGRW